MTTRSPFYVKTRGGGKDMRRTKEEVMIDILKIALDPVGPTKIMYRSNTSWKPLTEFLDKLTSAGLIELKTSEGRKLYLTTEKGVRLLKAREQLEIVLSPTREPATPPGEP